MIIKLVMANGDEYDAVTYPGTEDMLLKRLEAREYVPITVMKGKNVMINPDFIVSCEIISSDGLSVV